MLFQGSQTGRFRVREYSRNVASGQAQHWTGQVPFRVQAQYMAEVSAVAVCDIAREVQYLGILYTSLLKREREGERKNP